MEHHFAAVPAPCSAQVKLDRAAQAPVRVQVWEQVSEEKPISWKQQHCQAQPPWAFSPVFFLGLNFSSLPLDSGCPGGSAREPAAVSLSNFPGTERVWVLVGGRDLRTQQSLTLRKTSDTHPRVRAGYKCWANVPAPSGVPGHGKARSVQAFIIPKACKCLPSGLAPVVCV